MVTLVAAAAAAANAAVAVASPHSLVLTVSHGSPIATPVYGGLLPRRFVHSISRRLSAGSVRPPDSNQFVAWRSKPRCNA
jgi:hypothetical protein